MSSAKKVPSSLSVTMKQGRWTSKMAASSSGEILLLGIF